MELENGTNGTARMPAEVAAAICEVMAGIRTLTKDDTNPHQRYDFVSTDKFLAAVNPLCVKAGLVILQDEDSAEIVASEGKVGWLHVRYAFLLVHKSGPFWGPLHRTVMVPANGAQAYGSAQSYALKQFMRSVFQIPTGDKDDVDLQAKEQLPEHRTAAAKPASQKREAPPDGYEPEPAAEYATDAQNKFLTQLVRSHVIRPREREVVLQQVADGLLKEHATKLIDETLRTIEKREAAEEQAPARPKKGAAT